MTMESNPKYYSVGDGCAMPVYEVEKLQYENFSTEYKIQIQDALNEKRNHIRRRMWDAKKVTL